ncbi:hypothetical protein HJC23_005831 [Cyclotella cryptica]|uniref:Uncharacterized protein n=1 Tax=Cyclotella cryptica TaxID=29204 RepID=A0ABD3QYY5_9STRA|eukprot:CCRYP_000337-RB/>CCRYP_000337-RB protein AED:0.04 eAED:0.04 QI:204/1/1/1/0.25/0.2/5/5954/306
MLSFLLILITSTTLNAFDTQAFHTRPSHAFHSSALRASKPQTPQHSPIQFTPVPPPPPLSMPVWSLSCPLSPTSSAMSIVTFATPISVSSPKLWAVSLYKTSQTRCTFLGVANPGEEYNDIASTSSSVMNSARHTGNGMRRRWDVTLAGAEGAVGWRARRLDSFSQSRGTGHGVGILQLLTPKQSKLVPILGKKTGWDTSYSKKDECSREMGLDQGWISIPGSVNSPKGLTFDVLPNCASYIQLKLKRVTDGGDHDVAICEVIGTGVWDDKKESVHWLTESESRDQIELDSSSVLYSGLLREEGII